ncbi:unnamed protein product, partial [Closterium sp. NIES-53]
VAALDNAAETPELQALPIGAKVSVIGNAVCGKGEGSERDGSCSVACEKACEGAMRRHGEVVLRSTGYTIEDADARKAVRQCSSQCMRECTKSGRFSSFVAPFRF